MCKPGGDPLAVPNIMHAFLGATPLAHAAHALKVRSVGHFTMHSAKQADTSMRKHNTSMRQHTADRCSLCTCGIRNLSCWRPTHVHVTVLIKEEDGRYCGPSISKEQPNQMLHKLKQHTWQVKVKLTKVEPSPCPAQLADNTKKQCVS